MGGLYLSRAFYHVLLPLLHVTISSRDSAQTRHWLLRENCVGLETCFNNLGRWAEASLPFTE